MRLAGEPAGLRRLLNQALGVPYIVVSLLMLVLLLSACSGAQQQRESAWERCYDGALAIDQALGATTDQENGLVDVIYDVCDTRRPASDPRGGSFAKAILDTDVVLLCLKTPSCYGTT